MSIKNVDKIGYTSLELELDAI